MVGTQAIKNKYLAIFNDYCLSVGGKHLKT